MKKLIHIISLFAALLGATVAHAQFSKPTLDTQLPQYFPDNTTGYISPALLRAWLAGAISSWQQYPGVNAQVGTTYAIQASDYGQYLSFNNSSAIAISLPAGTVAAGFYPFSFYAADIGTGSATITPASGTIGGAATLVLAQGQSAFVFADGTNWQTIIFSGATAASITPGTTTIIGATAPCVIVNSTGTTSACIDLTNSYLAAGTFSNITGVGTLTVGAIGSGFTAIPNSALANSATTVNGQTCTLGSTCTVTATASSIIPGTTTIVGASAPCVINNSTSTTMACGAETGTGNFVLATSPTLTTPALGAATGTSLALGGATLGSNALAVTGSAAISSTLTSAADTITSASANALAVGLNGATNPAFNVDASTASQVAGLDVVGAATGGTVAIKTTDSGSANNLTINAKGSGTIGIGSASTGAVTITPAAVFGAGMTAASLATPSANIAGSICMTSGGVFLYYASNNCFTAAASSITPGTTTIVGATAPCVINNSTSTTMACGAETGTGYFVLSASPTLSGTVGGNITLGGNITFGGTITAASLSTPGTIAGAICATSGGVFLYYASNNCFAASASSITVGTTTIASGTASAIFYQNGASPTGTLGVVSGVTSNGTAMTFANGDLILSGSSSGSSALETSATGGGTITFQAGANTVAALNLTGQSLTGGAKDTEYSIGTVSTGTTTIACSNNPYQWMVDTGASTIAAPTESTADGCDVDVVMGNSAGAITLSGFTASPTGTGDAVVTANTASGTATFTNSSASIGFTNTLIAGQKVYFTTSNTLPTNFTANTIYYVISTGLSSSNIEVSATPGGSAITAGSAGSGTQTAHVPAVMRLIINGDNALYNYVWKQVQ